MTNGKLILALLVSGGITIGGWASQPINTADVVTKVDTLIDKINAPKPGADAQILSHIQAPFYMPPRPPRALSATGSLTADVVPPPPQLSGIFGSKARLDGKWHTIGDMVGEYTLVGVQNWSAILLRKGKQSTVSLQTASPKIMIRKVVP